MRLDPRLFGVLPLILLCSCAAGSLLAYKMSPDYPDDAANDTQPLTGLKAPAKITYDDWGVAHVEAASFEDLSRAAGYAQGRDRFFQLDLLRRLARGRVSELVGDQPLLSETTVDYDRTMRGWLIEQRCAEAVKKLTPEQRAILEAFASGVNQALAKWKPLEYRLLRVEPEAWTIEDSLAIGLLNVWSLSHNWSQEASRLVLAGSVGVDRAELIYPSDPVSGGRTIVSDGVPSLPPSVVPELAGMFPWKKTTTASRDTLHVGVDPLAMMGASNEWVVDGKHTKSGKPMLANDPHLSHLLPGMLYPMHVRVDAIGLDAIGVTMPGMPLVVLGHNQKVAWGMTSSVADAIDLVLEKPTAGGVVDERGPCPVTERTEVLKVRDGSELKERPVRLRQTCHGPVLNDIYPELLPDTAPLVSIRWNTEGLESTVDGLLALDLAGSTAEAGRAATSLPKLYQVFAAADVEGHIGLWSTGQVPRRPNHRGTFPVPGWVAKYDYNEWASGEQLPFSVDPAGGVLANGNNLVREPGVKGFDTLNVDAAQSFRHDRIVELIAQNPAHDSESMQKIQTDTASPRASKFRAAMVDDLSGAQLTGQPAAALDVLKAWDGSATIDSAGPSIFFGDLPRGDHRSDGRRAASVGAAVLPGPALLDERVRWVDDAAPGGGLGRSENSRARGPRRDRSGCVPSRDDGAREDAGRRPEAVDLGQGARDAAYAPVRQQVGAGFAGEPRADAGRGRARLGMEVALRFRKRARAVQAGRGSRLSNGGRSCGSEARAVDHRHRRERLAGLSALRRPVPAVAQGRADSHALRSRRSACQPAW